MNNGSGLIPACAGQTGFLVLVAKRWRAHPRVCGADLSNDLTNLSRDGSSPRVRGRPIAGLLRRWAGGAHPRVCGADQHGLVVGDDALGLIPACAGQTGLGRRSNQIDGAHPRVCGADGTNA